MRQRWPLPTASLMEWMLPVSYVRQEQLIAGQATGGTVSYQQSDGTMVKEGSVIAEVYSSSSDIALRRQIRALELETAALQRVSDARSRRVQQHRLHQSPDQH